MDVFISYRRDGGYAMARLVYECMRNVGLSVFLDLEELRSGQFNEKLYKEIENCKNSNFVIFFHQDKSSYLGYLSFHVNFRISLSISAQNMVARILKCMLFNTRSVWGILSS